MLHALALGSIFSIDVAFRLHFVGDTFHLVRSAVFKRFLVRIVMIAKSHMLRCCFLEQYSIS